MIHNMMMTIVYRKRWVAENNDENFNYNNKNDNNNNDNNNDDNNNDNDEYN